MVHTKYQIILTEIKVIVNHIICQQKLNSIQSNVVICFLLTTFLSLQNFTTPNEPLVCVCVDLAYLSHM